MQYVSRRLENMLPHGAGSALPVYNAQRRQRAGGKKTEGKGYVPEKKVEKPDLKESKKSYQDTMEEIGELIKDEEQAEQYVQLTGE